MMQKIMLLVSLALCLAFSPDCLASADSQEKSGTFSVDDEYTYLDTVKVVDCAKFVCKAVSLRYDGTSGEVRPVATKIIAVFSNDLMYSYVLQETDKTQELTAKGKNHIYHIKKGGYVVVKVKMTPKNRKIVEFIGNIDAN